MLNRISGFAVVALAALAACSKSAPESGAALPAAKGPAPAAPADDKSSWPKTLNVSAIPDIKNRDELLTTFGAFTTRLTKELGIEVKFEPVTDYPATVDGFAAGRLDLVWYGAVTSVQASKQSKGNLERLVCRAEDKNFTSVFVAAPDSGIKTLADLKGKTFSFGSMASTSGHVMPRYFMLMAGVDAAKDLAKFSFSGAHDATVKAVESGAVQAGALNYLVWNSMTAKKSYDPAKVALFLTSPDFTDYCWCARKDLPASLRKAIKDMFLGLDASKPDDKKLLDLQKATKYIACDDAWWKVAEDAAKALGMLKD
jgi:phosphonate transport system substrate-binding protein